MIKKLAKTTLAPYSEAEFFTMLRAQTLFYFNLLLAVITPFMLIALNLVVTRSVFSLLNIMLMAIVVTSFFSLAALKKGKYYLAANTMVLISLAAFAAYALFGEKKIYIGHFITGYHLLVFIVFSALFCGRNLTLFVSLIVLVISGTYLFITPGIPRKEAVTAVINCSFDIIIVSLICYLLLSINRKTQKKMKEEADRQDYYEAIENLITSVQDIAQVLASSSSEMSGTSLTFSTNAQDQASSAEEITATVEELSAGNENVARSTELQKEKIQSLTQEMKGLTTLTADMGTKISEALQTSSSIADQARSEERELLQMNTIMRQINERSGEMSGIISIINDISDQINLLSLNAAIEAARAGDAGRGFAVVADEISKLADQTTSSVKEISGLIKASESEIEQGIASVEKNVKMLTSFIEGLTSINTMVESLASFMEKLSSANQSTDAIAEEVEKHAVIISDATAEQKTAAGEIVKSLAVINELTQANATGAEEMAGSSEELSGLAEQLKTQVNTFAFRKKEKTGEN